MKEKEQDAILNKALKKLDLDYDRTFFVAIIEKELHPDNAVEIKHKDTMYYVTIKFGDFVCIYLN